MASQEGQPSCFNVRSISSRKISMTWPAPARPHSSHAPEKGTPGKCHFGAQRPGAGPHPCRSGCHYPPITVMRGLGLHGHRSQATGGGRRGVKLAPPVIGYHDTVNADVHARPDVPIVLHTLEHHGSRPECPDHLDPLPRHTVHVKACQKGGQAFVGVLAITVQVDEIRLAVEQGIQ